MRAGLLEGRAAGAAAGRHTMRPTGRDLPSSEDADGGTCGADGIWHLMRVRPMSEYSAARALQHDGFEVMLPCVRSVTPRPGHEDEPLFPGYLFVHYDARNHDWARPLRLPGVLGWVRFDGVVPSVPDGVVEELRARIATINAEGGIWTRFAQGQVVRVVSGRMEGLARVLDDTTSPRARVRVLLEMMGRQVSAKVPWSALRPVTSGPALGGPHSPRRTRGGRRWVRGFGPRGAPAVSPATG